MKCIKLTYLSPMFGSVECHELLKDLNNPIDINPEGMKHLWSRQFEIQEFLESHVEDLKDHVPEILREVVVQATFGNHTIKNDQVYFSTEIYVRQELTEIQSMELTSWIAGQMSDGWGEGLEQYSAFYERVIYRKPFFDEFSCEFDYEENYAEAYYCIHPWRANDFYLDLYSKEEVELDIPEPDTKQSALDEIKAALIQVIEKLNDILS